MRSQGDQLRLGLQALSARHDLGEVRGLGLLWALELGGDHAGAVVRACRSRGLLVNAARPHCLRFMPRLNGTPGEIAQGLALLDTALEEVLQVAA